MASQNVPQALWAVGNTFSCRLNGLVFTSGNIGTMMYTSFLSYYTMRRVENHNSLKDESLSRTLERKIHAFIMFFDLAIAVIALSTKVFNTYANGSHCTISAVPAGCRQLPEIYGECDNSVSEHSAWISIGVILVFPILIQLFIILCICRICHYLLVKRTRVFRGLLGLHADDRSGRGARGRSHNRTGMRLSSLRNSVDSRPSCSSYGEDGPRGREIHLHLHLHEPCQRQSNSETDGEQIVSKNGNLDGETDLMESCQNASPVTTGITSEHVNSTTGIARENGQVNSRSISEDTVKFYKREIMIQGFLYIATFFVTFVFVWCLTFANVILRQTPTVWMNSLAAICYPISGFLNILVYTRPKVISLRKNHPDYSWFKAFREVIKAGAVVPMIVIDGNNSHSSRVRPNELPLLEQGRRLMLRRAPSTPVSEECDDSLARLSALRFDCPISERHFSSDSRHVELSSLGVFDTEGQQSENNATET